MEYMFPGWFHLRPPECLFYGLYYFILANYHDNNGGAIFFFLTPSNQRKPDLSDQLLSGWQWVLELGIEPSPLWRSLFLSIASCHSYQRQLHQWGSSHTHLANSLLQDSAVLCQVIITTLLGSKNTGVGCHFLLHFTNDHLLKTCPN